MRVRRIAAKELVIGSVVAALAIGSALTTTSQAAPGPTTQKPPALVAEPAPSLTAAQSNEVNRYMVLTEMFWRKKQFKERFKSKGPKN